MKRTDKFNFASVAKRQKLQQQGADDIWGDDPEIDEIDRCMNLATQLCSQDQHNITVNNSLATYDDFKPKRNVHTSTQNLFQIPVASTSKQVTNTTNVNIEQLIEKVNTLESENKKLNEVYQSKDGEIAILRSKLTQIQKTLENEKIQKLRTTEENQQQWTAKLNRVTKEFNSLKCELDLKNLEIANLREKILEAKKLYNSNLNISFLNEENHIARTREINIPKTVKIIQTENDNIFPKLSTFYYPLYDTKAESLFREYEQQNSTTKFKTNSSILLAIEGESTICTNFLSKIEKNAALTLISIYPDLLKLMKCTKLELNSNIVTDRLRNILTTIENLLVSLSEKLIQISENINFGDNNLHCTKLTMNEYFEDCFFSENSLFKNEIAVDIRRCIAVITNLLVNCRFIYEYVSEKRDLQPNTNSSQRHFKFLNILLQLTNAVRSIRKIEGLSCLLAAIVKFLSCLCHNGELSTQCYEIMHEILKSMMFSQPNQIILKYVCVFLKSVSYHNAFMTYLCNSQKLINETEVTIASGDRANQDTCILQMFITEIKSCDISIKMINDIVHFVSNTIACNGNWMYHYEKQRCGCIGSICSLIIRIVYNAIENFFEDTLATKNEIKQIYYSAFLDGLVLLDTLIIKFPDFIYSKFQLQFHSIIKNINNMQNDLIMKEIHEISLKNLMSYLNTDVQKQCKITGENINNENIYNSIFNI